MIVRDAFTVDKVWEPNKESLDTASQQVNVSEAPLRESFSHCGTLSFVVHKYDYYFVFQILKSLQSSKLIRSVQPPVWEGYRPYDVKFIKFLLRESSFASHV